MTRQLMRFPAGTPRHQAGATLLVAIMMLLIITLLALSSMRGVSLESRITGNLKQQKMLMNAAEAALRMGETSITQWQCQPNTSYKNCVPLSTITATANADTPQLFNTTANAVNLNSVTSGYDVKIQWYVVDLKFLGGQSQNICALLNRDCGRHYYEITACASSVLCSSDTTTQRVILRTVFAVSDS